MPQEPIPKFDDWLTSRQPNTSGSRPALNWGAARKGHRHQGQDFGGAPDSVVGAVEEGEVVFAGPNGNMGNMVAIRHPNGLVSRYGHLNKINVAKGAKVTRGADIGLLGSTGNAKGPHVHYEVLQEDRPIDPAASPFPRPLFQKQQRRSFPTFDQFLSRPPAQTTRVTSPQLERRSSSPVVPPVAQSTPTAPLPEPAPEVEAARVEEANRQTVNRVYGPGIYEQSAQIDPKDRELLIRNAHLQNQVKDVQNLAAQLQKRDEAQRQLIRARAQAARAQLKPRTPQAPTAEPYAEGGLGGKATPSRPQAAPIRLTTDDAVWHFGMTPDEARKLNPRQKEILAAAVAEDQRRKDAGQAIQPPPLRYQQEMRRKAGLKPLAFNVQTDVESVSPYYRETAQPPFQITTPQDRARAASVERVVQGVTSPEGRAAAIIAEEKQRTTLPGDPGVHERVNRRLKEANLPELDLDRATELVGTRLTPDQQARNLGHVSAMENYYPKSIKDLILEADSSIYHEARKDAIQKQFGGKSEYERQKSINARHTEGLLTGHIATYIQDARDTEFRVRQLEAKPNVTVWDKIQDLGDRPLQLVPFLSSVADISEILIAGQAADKLERGETLSKREELTLRGLHARLQQQPDIPHRILDTISALPAFVGEFVTTGGVAALGKRAAIKGLEKTLTKAGLEQLERNLAGRLVTKSIGAVAGGAAQTIPSGLTRIPAGTLYRQELEGEDFAPALAKAIGDQFIEVTSERSGGLLQQIPVPKRLSLIRDALTARWRTAHPGRTASELQALVKKAGWHGVLGEMFEERVGQAARYATGLEDSLLPPWEQLLVEGVAFSVPGVGLHVASRESERRRIKKLAESLGVTKADAAGIYKYVRETQAAAAPAQAPPPATPAPITEAPQPSETIPVEVAAPVPPPVQPPAPAEQTVTAPVETATPKPAEQPPATAPTTTTEPPASVQAQAPPAESQATVGGIDRSRLDRYVFDRARDTTENLQGYFKVEPAQALEIFRYLDARTKAQPETVAPTPEKVENVPYGRQPEARQPEIREPRQPKSQTLAGKETNVSVPDSDRTYQARYVIREADDVIPSHNPQSFQPNADYYFQNDRRYENEQQYQMQVIERSRTGVFDPRRIANNSPTVDVGPPVIDRDGNVLGGNSRAMILQRVYASEDQTMAQSYRQELMDQASLYGLDAQQIASMKKPVLVRELSDEQLVRGEAQRAITDLNRPSTTPLTADESASAAATQLSEEAADFLTRMIDSRGDDATIASVMDEKGEAIINRLIEDGIIQAGERNTLLKDGRATPEAKTRIERMLVSSVYRDLSQMENTPPAIRKNIERIVVPLTRTTGTDWDISQNVQGAIDAVSESKAKGLDLDKLAAQQSMTREPYTESEIALAKVLLLGPRKTAEKFRAYGNDAAMAASGGGLFGAPTVPDSQKLHFGLALQAKPQTSRAGVTATPVTTPTAAPKPAAPALPETIERYQWRRNKEGGQKFGTQEEIRPLDEKHFDQYIKPRLLVPSSFAEYHAKNPDDTHIRLSRTDGGEWRPGRPFLGTLEDLRPTEDWAKKVTSFDSDEAREFGRTADSEVEAPDEAKAESEFSRDIAALLDRYDNQTERSWLLDSEVVAELQTLAEDSDDPRAADLTERLKQYHEAERSHREEYGMRMEGGDAEGVISAARQIVGPTAAPPDLPVRSEQDKKPRSGQLLDDGSIFQYGGFDSPETALQLARQVNGSVKRDGEEWIVVTPPEFATLKPTDQQALWGLRLAIGSTEGGLDRLRTILETNPTDEELTAFLGKELGLGGGASSQDPYHPEIGYQGGKTPKVMVGPGAAGGLKMKPTFQGKALLNAVRQLAQQSAQPTPRTPPSAVDTVPIDQDKFDEYVANSSYDPEETDAREMLRETMRHAGALGDDLAETQKVVDSGTLNEREQKQAEKHLADVVSEIKVLRSHAPQIYGDAAGQLIIDALDKEAQNEADELPSGTSEAARPAAIDRVGPQGETPLETLPAEPVRGTGEQRGSGSGAVTGPRQGERNVRQTGERTGDGSVSGRGTGDERVHIPETGDRTSVEPGRTEPIDHTGRDADRDAAKPNRTANDIIEGAEQRAAENAEDSPTSNAVSLAGDFFVEDAEHFSAGSLKQKYQRNIDAIITLRQIQSEGRERATPQEQATLARYIGWGQFPALFNEQNTAGREWAEERQALKNLLPEDEFKSARLSVLNAHYTAPQVVKMVWDVVRRLGFNRGRVLEPSMGVGNFFALMPRDVRKRSPIVGVELDKTTGQIAQLLYPNADIQIKGYQDYNVSDGFFDLIISNFPFGDYQVADARYPKRLKSQIHDYFFVRSLDKVRPGGLIVGITSTGTLDKQSTAVREYLAEHSDLVAAIRLPANTFLKEAGTAVVTDLIILRRRIPGEQSELATRLKETKWRDVVRVPDPLGGGDIPLNEYYAKNPGMIIGKLERSGTMYRGDAPNVTRQEDFEDHLQQSLASIPVRVYEAPQLKQFEPQMLPAPTELKQGSYTIRDGKLFQKTGEHLHELKPSADTLTRTAALVGLRDVLNNLLYVEMETPADAPQARKELGRVYDAFVKAHGYVHELKNVKAFADDPDRYRLLALENWNKKTKKATKTDVFTKPTRTRYEKPATAKGVVDAVGIALNETGSIDLERIASLLGSTATDVGDQLVKQGIAFNDPKGGWTARDTYLSGQVRRKLLEAREAARIDPQYKPNVEALEKVQPEDVPYSKISARMGAAWIPASDIAQFMADMMSAPASSFSVRHDKTTGRWAIGYAGSARLAGTVKDREELGTPARSFPEIIQAAIDDRPIRVTVKDGDVTYVDRKASAAANKKVREIRKKFDRWIWQQDERRARLHRAYNERYNDTIPLKVDGSHQTFPGMNELISLRANQKNVVWRGVTTGLVGMGHEVGTGKTFSMIATGMERRRLQLSRKPCIACLNANVAQVTEAAHLLYPNARILAAHEGMTADTRQKTVTHIATGDWDLVILTHDNLELIPMSKETQERFIRKEVDDLEAAVRTAKREAGSDKAGNRIVKDLEKKLENRRAALANVVAKPKDDAITFEETGIDFLMVDEAHAFKALPVYTARGSVKGVPTSRSDRATNMYMRSQWLLERNNNQGLVMATGTFISNTLVELYNFQRYLQRADLESRGIEHFDAWAANFAESQTRLEYTPTGDWLPVTRFSKFTNLADLSHLVSQALDVAFADEIEGLKRPKRKDEVIAVPMNTDQRAYLNVIRGRAAALAHAGRPQKGADNWLVLTNDARKAAIDMRLIDRSYPDDPHSKLNRMIEEAIRTAKDDPTKTQLIFSDMGIHATDRGISLYEDIIRKLVKGGIPRDDIIDFSKFSPGNKNDQRAKAEAMERLDAGKARVGLGGTAKLGTGVNVQKQLVRLHHLDAPYRPSDIEQRDGRGWRDGNLNESIGIGRYTTEGSFDTQMWQMLDVKNQFIRAFMRGDINVRTMEDQDTEELSYAQIMATTSGNPLLIKKLELEAVAAELESDFQVHEDQRLRLLDRISRHKRENQWATEQIKQLQQDDAVYQTEKDKEWTVTINGKGFTRDLAEEEAALQHDEALLEKHRELRQQAAEAKQEIAKLKAEAKDKGLLGTAITNYAKERAAKAFDILALAKKQDDAEPEQMPTTKIAEATRALREAIVKHIEAIKANYRLMHDQLDTGQSKPFGNYRGFDFVIVGESEDQLAPALVGPSGRHYSVSWASARPGQIFASMENEVSMLGHTAEREGRYVAGREDEITELSPLAEKPFPEMAELERMRKEIEIVTNELTASGASLPLPEDFSDLSTRYTSDGKLMPEEPPIDVHEEEGTWLAGEIESAPIFRDDSIVLKGNAPDEAEAFGTSDDWVGILSANEPGVQIVPFAIEDIAERVWFDNGMTIPLGYMDIIRANFPQAGFAITTSRRFPNQIVVLDGKEVVGYLKATAPTSIPDELHAAARMARERSAKARKAEKPKAASDAAADLDTAPASSSKRGGPSKPPPPPDPLRGEDEDPEEVHAMALSSARMPMSDVAEPGYGKARMSASEVIRSFEAILEELGRTTPIRVGRIAQRTARGIYKPHAEVIRLRTANNIPTAAHETGHAIQKVIYGSSKARALLVTLGVKRELVNLGKALYGSRKPSGGYRSEGWAEFMRHYLTTDDAHTVAPNTFHFFETQFLPSHPLLAKGIEKAREKVVTYQKQGAANRARANMKGAPSLSERISHVLQTARKVATTYMVDEFSPLFRLVREIESTSGALAAVDDPAKVASYLRGSAGSKVEYMVENGMLDFAGNKVGRPLADAAAIVKGKQREFTMYLWAKRSQERWRHEKLVTRPDGSVAHVSDPKNPGMTIEDADALVAQLETPEFEQAAQIVYDWNAGVLLYIKDAAPSLEPVIDKILADSQFYVPLMRVFELFEIQPPKGMESAGGSPLRRMKGSGRAVKDIFPQMIANAERMIASAHKRRVLDTIMNLAALEGMGHLIEEVPRSKVPFSVSTDEILERLINQGAKLDLDDAEIDEVFTFFTPAKQPKGQDPIVPVMRDGQMRWYYVNPDLYNTLMGLDLYRLPKVLDLIFGVPTRVFRAGTTGLRAAFALFTNPTRDLQSFIMQTQSHKNPALLAAYWTRSMAAAFSPLRATGQRDPYLDMFYRLGAQLGQPLGIDIALTRKTAKRLFRGKVINTITDPLNLVREFLSLPESASRVAELRALADEVGWQPGEPMTFDQALQLGLAAKQVTVDFSAAGSVAKVVNQAAPFFNATIQGGRSFGRAMRDHPRRSVLRGLLLMTIPTLLLWWRNKDKEWWVDMPYREKYMFWHIEAGNQVIEIPRAFEWGNMFAVVPEAIFDSWYRKDPEGVKAAVGHIFETTVPDVLPVPARVAKEQWQNRIDFFDRPIVPRGEIDLPPGEQRGPYTSAIAKWLGRKFPDTISPRRVDALIRGFGGGVAPDVLNVIGLGSQRGTREREVSDLPVFGRAFRQGGTEGFGSQALTTFYDTMARVKARAASKDRPETNEQREFRLVLEDANHAISLLRTIQAETSSLAMRQQIGRVTRQIAKTALDTSLSAEERTAKLGALLSEQPVVSQSVESEVTRRKAKEKEERQARPKSRSEFNLPGELQPRSGPRPPSPPTPP